MQTLDWTSLNLHERRTALVRPAAQVDPNVAEQVREILDEVRENGDAALLRLTQKFDGVVLDGLITRQDDLKSAWQGLSKSAQAAIDTAIKNVKTFHTAQLPTPINIETMQGVICRREPRALASVGIYVPGGTAPLISTVIMLAVPATIAGVARIAMTTPPGKDGQINTAVLAAAYRCGVTEVYAVGGAQAVAALAYGTKSIAPVSKIFGPGNLYVATAKSMVASEAGGPAIDLPAGPSEVMVVADETANPVFVAADLLSQAEHDTASHVVCIAANAKIAAAIKAEVKKQIETLPRRDIAGAAMERSVVVIATKVDWVSIIELYAPEHLILQCENAQDIVENVRSVGSVFVGPWTPEAVGDYASGTNHTLPTFGAAKSYSGLGLESYMTFMTVQEVSKSGLRNLAPCVTVLADLEGLEAHRRAITFRMAAIDGARDD